jgi:putative aldouronate transport system substrate-binding protein
MKRFMFCLAAFAAVLALTLAACKGKGGAVSGSGPEPGAPLGQTPIVKEKITYTLATSLAPNWGNPNEGEFWKNWEAETNIHINWIAVNNSEAGEKYSIMMSSGDYPDGFFAQFGGGTANILRYGVQQGVYIPLTKLIPENMPHFMDRMLKLDPDTLSKQTAPNGEIYSLPAIAFNDSGVPNAAFINKTWLNKLGLSMPATTDQFVEVLRAFKTRDPNGNGIADEIPLSLKFDDWGAYDHSAYFGSFGYPISENYLIVDKGKVVFIGASDGFKAGADFFSKLYREGLLDREIFTMTEPQIVAKENLEPMVLGAFNSWANYSKNHKDDYALMMPLKGPNGDQNWKLSGSGSLWYGRDRFSITNKAKNPEILLRWADQFYRDFETSYTAMYGMGPDPNKYWNYDANGSIKVNENYPPEYERGMQQLPFPPVALDPDKMAAMASGLGKDKVEYERLYTPYLQKYTSGEWENFPDLIFTTEEENEELSVLETEIIGYTKNQLARWISGDGSVNAEWNAYLAELEKIGLARYLELQQKIYNRFKGK